MYQHKFHFVCENCNKTIVPTSIKYLCDDCEKKNTNKNPTHGVLKTIYDYKKIKQDFSHELFKNLSARKFIDILPIQSAESLSFLKVGETPIYNISENVKAHDYSVFLKDDSQNPTFSLKDRASNLVTAFAKENKIKTIIAASTGNAGSSLAGICASQKQKSIIIVPASAPKAKLIQAQMYGGKIIPVKSNYDSAFDLSISLSKKYGFYNRNTAYNPLTIEGKKTVAFEIFSQLGDTVPDRIFVPVGDGVIISAVYKGFEDLLKLQVIDKMPTIVAVQAIGSSNLISNLYKSNFVWKSSKTIADSISVDIPRNFFMARNFIIKYQGETILLNDKEILEASDKLSKSTGIFAEPAASASFAAFTKYAANNKLKNDTINVILSTGSGLKDVKSVENIFQIQEPIEANIEEVIRQFGTNILVS
ncbi:MAG: pyridoxal-phosphate dependent enzyme [Bacteroidetes bacterium]|jgi:threonine synthase|nr:pyridoxal-phosphate dependent enzyme [Bacteroidota bacterium]MBT6686265.1 pyridoxal-phosphate dependent enzyme [Bacteroidota bacterium]MBT7142641.1 pyridoxal-phosphate dependent enzyme [Bacteroidota bacterium]MBT7492773.1 pyridoxal-phosphate dependent enzyme [Bacteroidota bacterium]